VDHLHLDSKLMPSRRTLLGIALFSLAVAAVATMPQLLGPQVGKAIGGLDSARPVWLWAAALGFVGSMVFGSWAWRSAAVMVGARMDKVDAAARFSIGSLVNSFLPARLGEAARIGLFSRRIEGDDKLWKTGGIFAAVASGRGVAQALMVVAAFVVGALPLWPVFVLLAGAAAGAGVAFFTRNRTASTHVAHVLDAFRMLGRRPGAAGRIVGWCVLAMAARVGAASAICAALGIHHPVVAALIIVPALDVASIMPLTPGNVGVASGAVAVALESRGVGLTTALSAGIALHVVETATSIVLGLLGTLSIARFRSPTTRRWAVALGSAAACLALAAAFGATVLRPLI
jgi:uncharacterized membrane protein YbhN (UPF0104 family)